MSRQTFYAAGLAGFLILAASPALAQDNGAAEPRPIMANLKIGPAIGLADFKSYNAFALELEGGYAILDGKAYITFSPSFAFGDLTLVTIPAGFQYNYALPVENLSATGRGTVGVAFFTEGGDPVAHVGVHLGAKYQISPLLHAGFEPLSLPMYFGNGATGMHLRLMAYVGADF